MNFNELTKNAQVLGFQEMKSIKGGGSCGYAGPVVEGKRTVFCNISKAEAMFWFGDGGDGANWCCESCGSSSYCG